MTLPGGTSDKLGNRYEGRWTLLCMVRILDERADSIRLEPPGSEGGGVEFWLRTADGLDYHQVKRQATGRGRWNLGQLHREGVLSTFNSKLDQPNTHCTFVSTHAADQLDELSTRAKKTPSYEEFTRNFIVSRTWSDQFSTLREYWGNCPEVEAYQKLKRISVRTIDEESLREQVEFHLSVLVDGDPSIVAALLAQLALDRVSTELTEARS